MRSKIKRAAICVMAFGLPISLPQARHDSGFGIPMAQADGTLNRLMRWTGYGWSSGYHTCRNERCGVQDALPPVGNAAGHGGHPKQSGFELVDPQWNAYQVSQPNNYAFAQPQLGTPAPSSTTPGYTGQSLVYPQLQSPAEAFPPYRSVVPQKTQKDPIIDQQERSPKSPSDMELLPLPKDRAKANNGKDEISFEHDSASLVGSEKRSASATQNPGRRSR